MSLPHSYTHDLSSSRPKQKSNSLYKAEATRSRLRKLLLAEVDEVSDGNGELAEETDPEPGIAKTFKAAGDVWESWAGTDAVQAVGSGDDGCYRSDHLSEHQCPCNARVKVSTSLE